MDKVKIRNVAVDDLDRIQEYLAQIGWEYGTHILELYFTHSRRTWIVGLNESNEIVFLDSVHELPISVCGRSILNRFLMYVREDYQNRGLIKAHGLIFKDAPPTFSNATSLHLKYLRISPGVVDTKIVHYVGRPTKEDVERFFPSTKGSTVSVTAVEPDQDISSIITYDRSVLNFDRSAFMRHWIARCSEPDRFAVTLVARNEPNGAILGFGTLRRYGHRRYTNYYCITPLYANDQSIATSILKELLAVYQSECDPEEIHLYFNAKNRFMIEFARKTGFEHGTSFMRMYYRGSEVVRESIGIDKVYALLEYWPV